jgi:hypothetical protein
MDENKQFWQTNCGQVGESFSSISIPLTNISKAFACHNPRLTPGVFPIHYNCRHCLVLYQAFNSTLHIPPGYGNIFSKFYWRSLTSFAGTFCNFLFSLLMLTCNNDNFLSRKRPLKHPEGAAKRAPYMIQTHHENRLRKVKLLGLKIDLDTTYR